MAHNLPRIQTRDIEEQARKIRDIAQAIIDACQSGKDINTLTDENLYARNMVTSGSLAQDAAILSIYIIAHEMQGEEG